MGHQKLDTRDPKKTYPKFLTAVAKNKRVTGSAHPTIVKMYEQDSAAELEKLIKNQQITEVIDNYGEQYAELLLSKNAHLYRANHKVQTASIANMLDEHYGGKKSWKLGSWAYFPWSGNLVHVLAQKEFEELRSIRNRDLISAEEQTVLSEFSTANFGMSVGSAGALALAISGISRKIKLIDGAVISGSNLNRILTGVSSVGRSKCEVIGSQIYEMNPYSEVEYFDKADKNNVDKILSDVGIAIDEIDDIEMKIRIRIEARKRKIPVVMATELGDTIMLDIERFDEEPDRELFHGLIPGIHDIAENPPENHREWTKHAVSIIDPANMPLRMQHSLLKIGTTIVTHPQLGSTVMVTGGALAFAVKNIALGNRLRSGRYVISLEKEMLVDHQTRKYRRQHKKHTRIIHKAVKSM
ncbi:MAG TPA: ThiF family adenylyltransferase [Candidatus Saccharimonadales bacterium]|nr:ThiF family adenylyltransferase [Candidatus Saccharimonadales bacterium]